MNKHKRDLLIFSAVAVGAGWLGLWLNQLEGNTLPPMQSLGALVWLVAPALTGLLLRWLGGTGFGDAGLRPNIRKGWRAYLAGVWLYPLLTLLGLGLAVLAGTVSAAGLARAGLGAYLGMVAAMFGGSFVKNIFEEMAWRGFLAPRARAAGLGPLAGNALVALVWWAWHLPYYASFLPRADLAAATPYGLPVFLVLGLLVLLPTSFFFDELRQAAGSVWAVVLLHCVINAISMPLTLNGLVTSNHWGSLLLAPTNESALMALLMGAAGWRLRKRRLAGAGQA